ncbi:MAG: secondary thiamine-phosphate synthase enzyme YjbQ [Bacteroidota bacterium]|nr:secondary thiamine-phosphate synthase enzyme YjbQ [Bacteroidota bacterium]
MIHQKEIQLKARPRGYHLIDNELNEYLTNLPDKGIVHLFIKHTSAGLMLNENADPSVRHDFKEIMNRLIPENEPYYTHTAEGSDDMPSHVKSGLIGADLSIPVRNGQLSLGTWQGIYLCEFRNQGGPRKILLTVYS